MNSYDAVKQFYKENFNVDGYIVDLLADYEIMYYCVIGLSNSSISESTDIDESIISKVLTDRLGFSGWKINLEFNPLYIYTKVNGIETMYFTAIKSTLNVPNFLIKKSFEICNKFVNYEKILDERYK